MKKRRKLAALLTTGLFSIAILPAGADAAPGEAQGQSFAPSRSVSAVVVRAVEYSAAEGAEIQKKEYAGQQEDVLYTTEGGWAEWEITVEEAGEYELWLTYVGVEGRGASIERGLKINGDYPLPEAETFTLSRIYENETNEPIYDANDHQRRPRQVEVLEWQTAAVKDDRGLEVYPLRFRLEQGTSLVRLEAEQEDMLLLRLEFRTHVDPGPYSAYAARYAGQREVTGIEPIVLEGESACRKSDSVLYPYHDRISPMTSPFSISKIRMNYIGGENWKIANQWIEWEFEVEEPGLYQIALRSRQNYKRGIFVYRNIYLDGEIPFSELEQYAFSYDQNWNNEALHDEEGNPFLFFLDEGKHTFRMEVSLGKMVEVIDAVNESVLEINRLYRSILMVTGPVPDPIRDYELEKVIPDFLETLEEQSALLREQKAGVEAYTGQKGGELAAFERMAVQLDIIREDPSDLTESSLEVLRSNASSLAAWVLSISEQPLDIDYITINPTDAELPPSDVGFFRRVLNEIQAYFASFFEDYSIVGQNSEEGETLEVWVPTGRDQAQIIKQLADEYFTPEYNISVNVRLVRADVLLPAIVAQKGPDVAVQVARDLPVNYGTRNALSDLSVFPGFDEVIQRFDASAVTPLGFAGKMFALPETQSFNMLFYRSDILEEYGFSPPETWQELHNMAAILKKDNLEVGIPFDINTYSAFLFQRDGQFYSDDGLICLLDAEEGVEAFIDWTDLRTQYRYPIQFDLINRFRTGEMPLALGDFTTCNYLSVFAPEIKGLWGMVPIPGTETDDGIRREETSTGTAAFLVAASSRQESGWKFLDWWTDTQAQLQYGREIECLLGPSSRYATANLEAFSGLAWDKEQMEAIERQREWLEAIPEVPGGYFMPRHLNNALRAVIYDFDDPRYTIAEYTETINNEMREKQDELGYGQGRN